MRDIPLPHASSSFPASRSWCHPYPVRSRCISDTLAKNFLDTNDSTQARQGKKPVVLSEAAAARQQAEAHPDPFKLARLPDSAWKQVRLTGAAAAPFATSLPPIGSQ